MEYPGGSNIITNVFQRERERQGGDTGDGEGPAVFGCWYSEGKEGVLFWNCLKSVLLTTWLLASKVCCTFLARRMAKLQMCVVLKPLRDNLPPWGLIFLRRGCLFTFMYNSHAVLGPTAVAGGSHDCGQDMLVKL